MSIKNKEKLYKSIQTIAIVGLLGAVSLLVLGIGDIIPFSSGLLVLIGVIATICGCCLLACPWIRRLENNDLKILCFVFLGLIAVVCILWVICIFQIQRIYKISNDETISDEVADKTMLGILKFFKASAIISIQFVTASTIASTLAKYRKSYLPIQVIMYASHIFVDFYVTFFMCCITTVNGDLKINDNISILWSKFMVILFVLALLYVIITNAVLKRIEGKRITNLTEDVAMGQAYMQSSPESKTESAEDKLLSLKTLYEKELVTKEEYEAKRSEIIKKM